MKLPFFKQHQLSRRLLLSSLFALPLCSPTLAETGSIEVKTGTQETMTIGQTIHIIPEPWAGNRIDAPSLPMSAFSRIPKDHSRNGSSLYLVQEAHTALLRLLAAARADGIHLQVDSAYRSPGYQEKIFRKMMSEGREFDDIVRYVAPPGYSEHALGTAVDFFPSNWRFAGLAGYTWLRAHAANYGFKETYPRNNSLKYPWEAWHWAYLRPLDTARPAASIQTASADQPR